VVAPRYSLERVVRAATDGDINVVGPRARDIVEQYLDSLAEAVRFARAVVASLTIDDFEESVQLSEPPYAGWYDVYIRLMPDGLQEEFGMQHSPRWYLKLKLVESDVGDTVVCVSLHPAEHPSRRARRKS